MTTESASIASLVEDYHRWVRDNTVLKTVNTEWSKIVTPWLNVHNDCLEVYVREDSGQILLSDGGSVAQELDFMGVNWRTGARRETIQRALLTSGASLSEDDAIELRVDRSNFPQKKIELLQTMVAIGELANVSARQVGRMFADDVNDWLLEADVRFSSKVQFQGKSGFSHRFLGVIPPAPKQHLPERMLLALNRAGKDQVGALIWSWQDVMESRSSSAELYVFLQDENETKNLDTIESALQNFDIKAVRWSKRENVRSVLAA